MDTLPERGRLAESPLPRLLLRLQRARFTGALRLTRDRVEKRFLYHLGAPVTAHSNLASERLGTLLVDRGLISLDDQARIDERVREQGCQEGQALLELALLEPRALFLALKDQLRMRLVECFGWSHGEFSLEAGAAPPEETHPLRGDPIALIQDGIETHWSPERTIAELAERMGGYPAPVEGFDRLARRLSRDEATEAFLARLDGRHTLWQALQAATGSRRALAAAWVLDASGALRYARAARAEGADDPQGEPEVEIVLEDSGQASKRARAARAAASPARAAARNDAATQALRRQVNEKFVKLEQLDFYAVLGLDPAAEPDAIKAAYLAAAKTYHPDALTRAGLDKDARVRATRVFAKMSKAYAVLSDPKRRGEYDASRGGDDPALDANRLATAESLYRKGEVLLRQGNFRGALEFLKPCVDLWPDECAYQSAFGWCLYKKTPSDPDRAREHLEIAARLDPGDGVNRFRLGVVLRSLDGDAAAE
jgi:DnaJ-domain-containing protein 1